MNFETVSSLLSPLAKQASIVMTSVVVRFEIHRGRGLGFE